MGKKPGDRRESTYLKNMPYHTEFREDLAKIMVSKVAYCVLEEEKLKKLAAEQTE